MRHKIIIIIILLVIVINIHIGLYILSHQTTMIEINKIAEENATINGRNYRYDNPVIPKGFKAARYGATWNNRNGIVEGWNEGLVIEDEEGNQFVWVPVNGGVKDDGLYNNDDKKIVEYKKWHIYNQTEGILEDDKKYLEELVGEKINNLTAGREDIKEDCLPSGVISEEEQIKKYGGFYIARYEAGISEKDLEEIYSLEKDYNFVQVTEQNNMTQYNPVSKRDSQIWNFIEYKNAKKVSEEMYQTENVRSGLMTGRQFDTIMRWADCTGYSLNNATSWGNFFDTTGIIYTGRYASYLRKKSEDWKIKDYGLKEKENIIFTGTGEVQEAKMNEIYDIAGNVFEFTTDLYKGKVAIVRGGCAAYGGNENSIHPVMSYSFRRCATLCNWI